MKPPKGVTLISAKYISDYFFQFTFSDGIESLVNFEPIITYGTSLLKFLDKSEFKKINIDNARGDIYWGKDWDMCFHIETIYGETEVLPAKRQVGQLNEYHKQRNVAAYRAVQEMSKQPYSAKEKQQQARRLNNQSYKNREQKPNEEL